MRAQLSLVCATSSNAFYYAPIIPCILRQANYVASANQGGTKTVVISKAGGNTIISGDLSATGGTPTEGTLTSTLADAKQVISKTAPLLITINLSGGTAATVVMDLLLDEYQVTTVL
jgi:hypothetical protein